MDAEAYRDTLDGLPFKPGLVTQLMNDIVDRDGKLGWLKIRYYMLNVTEDEKKRVRQIRAGMGTDMSVGFSCGGYDAVYTEDGKELKWFEFAGTEEWPISAMEASHVFLGRQYGAGVVQAAEDDDSKAKPVSDPVSKNINQDAQEADGAVDDPVSTPDDAAERQEPPVTQGADGDGAEPGGADQMIKIESAVLELTKEVDGTDEKAVQAVVAEMQAAYEAKLEAMTQLQTDLDAAKARIEVVEAVFGEGAEKAVMEQAKQDAAAYRSDLIEQTVTMGNRVGMIADDEVDGEKEQLQSVELDQIKKTLQRYEKLYNAGNKNSRQTADGGADAPEMIEVSAGSVSI
jgi:hypothetical protein